MRIGEPRQVSPFYGMSRRASRCFTYIPYRTRYLYVPNKYHEYLPTYLPTSGFSSSVRPSFRPRIRCVVPSVRPSVHTYVPTILCTHYSDYCLKSKSYWLLLHLSWFASSSCASRLPLFVLYISYVCMLTAHANKVRASNCSPSPLSTHTCCVDWPEKAKCKRVWSLAQSR